MCGRGTNDDRQRSRADLAIPAARCPSQAGVRLAYFKTLDQHARGALAAPPQTVKAAQHQNDAPRAPRSYHGHAAVDVQRLSGDVAGFIRREIDGRRGDLVAGSNACGGDTPENGLALLVVEL